MPFIPESATRGKLVQGSGRKEARICIVGDYTDKLDAAKGVPFFGPAGGVLDSCLHAAGLIRAECYITNVIKEAPTYGGKGPNGANSQFAAVNNQGKLTFTQAGLVHVNALHAELRELGASVLVAAGPAAWTALTGRASGLNKNRGYVRWSLAGMGGCGPGGERKVIPTFAPGDTIWKNYTNRTVISIDLKKAKAESLFPEWRKPERKLILQYDSVGEALAWLDLMGEGNVLSFDIEVINYEVACISFSTDPSVGVVIPILDRWTEEEEVLIWRAVQRVLGNPLSIKVAQNGIFDIHFLLTRCGIEVRGEIHDTMIGHSVMFTELPKGLGFLGSIYCGSQPEWKTTVKFDDVKGES